MSYSRKFEGLSATYYNKVFQIPFAHVCEETGRFTDDDASGRFTLNKSPVEASLKAISELQM